MSDTRPLAPQSTVIPTHIPNSEAHAASSVPDSHPPTPPHVMPESESAPTLIALSANAEPSAESAATSAAEPQSDPAPGSHPIESPATPPASHVITTSIPSPTINMATRPSITPQRVASPEHALHHQSSSRDQLSPLPTSSALALARDRDLPPPPLPNTASHPSSGASHATRPASYPTQSQAQFSASQNPIPQRRRSYSPHQDVYAGVALQGADGLGRNISSVNFAHPRAPRPVMVSSGGGERELAVRDDWCCGDVGRGLEQRWGDAHGLAAADEEGLV
ncbi:hypothetical protein EWM64_g9712 [Hericium alpestre]|uniref:Uncharacterized protein n=1 Tax=Hericium alpestre TaxID=135208 RepID=A0A4Y9ZLJ3_9AGAM|nr:hypothetical protein EWM64_g9712 [Hericium alpestre]